MERIGGSIIVAALIIAAAILLKPAPPAPRYVMSDGPFGLIRMDTRTGALENCAVERCHPVGRPSRVVQTTP